MHIHIRPFYTLQYDRDVLPQRRDTLNMSFPSHVATWRLGAIINGLLRHGPRRMASPDPGSKPKPLVIKKSVVEIHEPELGAHVTDENDVACVGFAEQQGRELVSFSATTLDDQLSARRGGAAEVPWGPLALAHVRGIVVMSKGEVLKEIDLAAHARALGAPIYEPTEQAGENGYARHEYCDVGE